MEKLNRFWKIYDWVVLKVTTILYIAMSLVCFANVVGRFCFNSPLVWGDEASLYLVAWFVFLASAICTKDEKHIYVENIRDYFKGTAKLVVELLINLMIIILMIVLAWSTFPLMEVAKIDISATLKISRFWVYFGVEIGFIITIINAIRALVKKVMLYKEGKL